MLVAWYRDAARALPWRDTRDPYAIWVSEIMLQQTRVETVHDRWGEFLARFPSLRDLAAAPLSDVLAAWAGLGYYRRARQLHAAAQSISKNADGRLPRSAAALRLLPGFGPYTAGAVASIAYDEAVAAVDGNVERVLARLLGIETNVRRGEGAKWVREAATHLVGCERPRDLNQALMELGATVCTPREPNCDACPWRRSCAARRTGTPEQFPARVPRPATLEVASYAAVLRRDERYLWRRRPEGGLNAGLWELPTTEWHGGTPDEDRAAKALGELARQLGCRWSVGPPLAKVRHGITHHRVTVVGYAVEGNVSPGSDRCLARIDEAREMGITAAASKLSGRLPTLL